MDIVIRRGVIGRRGVSNARVCSVVTPVMVSVAGIQWRLLQHIRINVKYRCLELRICTFNVGIVTQHKHKVGILAAVVCDIPIVYQSGIIISCSGIPQHPDATRILRTRSRCCVEEIVCATGEHVCPRINLVKILRSGIQSGEAHLVVYQRGGFRNAICQAHYGCSVINRTRIRINTSPSDGHFIVRCLLKIRSAKDRYIVDSH